MMEIWRINNLSISFPHKHYLYKYPMSCIPTQICLFSFFCDGNFKNTIQLHF